MLREIDTLTPPIISGTYGPPMEVTITHHKRQDFVPTDPYKYIYKSEAEYMYFKNGEPCTDWVKRGEHLNPLFKIRQNYTVKCRIIKTTNPNWQYIRSLPFLKMCRAITMIIADNIKFK